MNKNIKKTLKRNFEYIKQPIAAYHNSKKEKRNTKYVKLYQNEKIKDNVVLYEAFYGRGLLCGPYALFDELINNPEYSHLKHIWVLDSFDYHAQTINKYKKFHNVIFVEFESKQYFKYLASAHYLVNNSTFGSYFIKKAGQVYVNTWHGIPLKSMGYDEPLGVITAANTIKNFFHVDYLISANPFLTEVYKKAYKQDGMSNVKIIEEGYPRLDTLVKTDKKQVFDDLRSFGVKVDDNKKIILYAPTWKGTSFGNPDLGIDEYIKLKKYLESNIDTSQYQILIKVHQVVYSKIRNNLADYDYIVPATIDANAILGITDILISDYSSIYFDYLATDKPLLFYIPDIKGYENTRGMYFQLDELPGPYTNELNTLSNWINNIDEVFEENKERYNKVKNWCCNYDIGSISKKIARIIFKNDTTNANIISLKNDKKKILFSRGPMLVNGITTAFINILNQIDYDKYDVTVIVNGGNDAERTAKILELNKNARVLVKPGASIKTVGEAIKNNFYLQYGPVNKALKKLMPKEFYEREFKRLFGEEKFDYIIDYEGYNIFFATMCLMQPDARTCIWLHNDMLSEYTVRFKWLKRMFALYPYFDRVVSCSKEIMEVNRKNFSNIVPYEKFYYAKNTINFDQVINGINNGQILSTKNANYFAINKEENNISELTLIPLQPQNSCNIENGDYTIINSNERFENGITRFVSVGRLSPEKNQDELIRAFARIVKENPNTMLYILGEGRSRKALNNLINTLGLSNNVILTGNLSNPFGMMKQCHCFILPSIHEGQPLVILEARLVKMPIIVSNFSSVGGSLIENGQIVINQDADSIYEGLRAFLDGKVPDDYKFDHNNYNIEAYDEFCNAVFGD